MKKTLKGANAAISAVSISHKCGPAPHFRTANNTSNLSGTLGGRPHLKWTVSPLRIPLAMRNCSTRHAPTSSAINAALRIRSVRMTERGDQHVVGVVRIDPNARNVLRVFQSDVLPRLAGIGRFVDAIAIRDIPTQAGLACPQIDHIRIRYRHGNRAD